MELSLLLERLRQALGEGIVVVQIWDNFTSEEKTRQICTTIRDVCHQEGIPVLLNNRWDIAVTLGMDGVHFDEIPADWKQIQASCANDMLLGITLNNDMELASWAVEQGLDYVSFCSMFPSETASSCDLVALDTVRTLTRRYAIPVFLAGGIRLNNLDELNELDYHGIAVVSGVMGAENPAEAVRLYNEKIKK
jgi:thiamine-phosphate pyrophosphorylase